MATYGTSNTSLGDYATWYPDLRGFGPTPQAATSVEAGAQPSAQPAPVLSESTIDSSAYGQVIPALIGTHLFNGMPIWRNERIVTGDDGIARQIIDVAILFIDDLFERTHEFQRVEFGDKIIYSTAHLEDVDQQVDEEAFDYVSVLRLYTGTATQDPDPLIVEIEGEENTPAWRHYVYLVAEGVDAEFFGTSFQVRALITNATNDAEGFPEIILDYIPPAREDGLWWSVMDHSLGRMYQLFGDPPTDISVVDFASEAEISRVTVWNLPGDSALSWKFALPIEGTGWCVSISQSAGDADQFYWLVIDAVSGQVIASFECPTDDIGPEPSQTPHGWGGGGTDNLIRSLGPSIIVPLLTASGVKYAICGSLSRERGTVGGGWGVVLLFDPAAMDITLLKKNMDWAPSTTDSWYHGYSQQGKTVVFGVGWWADWGPNNFPKNYEAGLDGANGVVKVTIWQDGSVDLERIYINAAPPVVTSLWYVPSTHKLLVSEASDYNMDDVEVHLMDPDTGVIEETWPVEDGMILNNPYVAADFQIGFFNMRGSPDKPHLINSGVSVNDPADLTYINPVNGGLTEILSEGRVEFITDGDFDVFELVAIDMRASFIYGRNWSGDYETEVHRYGLGPIAPGEVTYELAATELCTAAGYAEADLEFDNTDICPSFTSVVIAGNWALNAILRSISEAFGVSVVDRVGLHFRKPLTDEAFVAAVTVPQGDLIEVSSGDGTRDIETTATNAIDDLYEVAFSHFDPDSDYEAFPTTYRRTKEPLASTFSNRSVSLTPPIGITVDKATQLCAEYLFRQVAGMKKRKFSLPPEYFKYDPADLVIVQGADETITVIIDKASQRGDYGTDYQASDWLPSVAAEHAGQSAIVPDRPAVTAQLSKAYVLDIPLWQYGDDPAETAIVQYGLVTGVGQTTWSGGSLWIGTTPVATQRLFSTSGTYPVTGFTSTALATIAEPLGDTYDELVYDAVNDVDILVQGDATRFILSASDADIIAGRNRFLIGTEILQAKTIVNNGGGNFTLSNLRRGLFGTDVNVGTHTAHDLVVYLNGDDVQIFTAPTDYLADTIYYKGVGLRIDPTRVPAVAHVMGRVPHKPLAPVLPIATVGTDIVLTWTRRSRISALWGSTAPLGEQSEEYEVEWFDSSDLNTVVRLYAGLTTPTNTYTAAHQAADFPGGLPASLTARIYQISQFLDGLDTELGNGLRGRGFPRDITVSVESPLVSAGMTLGAGATGELVLFASAPSGVTLGASATATGGTPVTGDGLLLEDSSGVIAEESAGRILLE